MGQAIGQVLPLAVGVALSPVPIIAVVLMLVTPRARVNGLAFVVGWIVGLGIVGAIVLAIADPAGATSDGQPATWVDVLKLVLGLLLLLVALKQWRGRPHGDDEPATPTWMGAIEGFGPGKAFVAGAVLAGANPKNALLAIAAAASIAAEEALAYASIAGVSPVVGLYAAPGALILYAAFGSPRHLVVGPMSATAALSAASRGDRDTWHTSPLSDVDATLETTDNPPKSPERPEEFAPGLTAELLEQVEQAAAIAAD
jgi:threonine/homoserine/homoserine lactone efflux protein